MWILPVIPIIILIIILIWVIVFLLCDSSSEEYHLTSEIHRGVIEI